MDPHRTYLWTLLESADGSAQEVRVPIADGIVGFVATTGETVHIPDAYADARFKFRQDTGRSVKTRNILASPVNGPDGEVSAVLEVANKNGGKDFSIVDEVLLSLLGTQAGIMIRHAQESANDRGKHESARAVAEALPGLVVDYIHCSTLTFVSKVEEACKGLFRAKD